MLQNKNTKLLQRNQALEDNTHDIESEIERMQQRSWVLERGIEDEQRVLASIEDDRTDTLQRIERCRMDIATLRDELHAEEGKIAMYTQDIAHTRARTQETQQRTLQTADETQNFLADTKTLALEHRNVRKALKHAEMRFSGARLCDYLGGKWLEV